MADNTVAAECSGTPPKQNFLDEIKTQLQTKYRLSDLHKGEAVYLIKQNKGEGLCIFFSNETFINLDGEEQKAVIEEMRYIVEKNSFVNAKLNKANEVIESITELRSSDDKNPKLEDILEEYKQEMEKIDPDVSKDRNLVEFNRQVKDLLKDTENALDTDPDGNDDDDLQFTQDTVNVIDPFTKQRMTDPMRNKTCSHVYDRKSVNAMLKVNPRTRCPVVGCGNKEYIFMDNLESDIVLRTRLLKKTV